MGLRIIYLLNILLLGIVAFPVLFRPFRASSTIFQNAFEASKGLAVVGSFWVAILLLSIGGLFYPRKFEVLLLVQILYKAIWLLAVALPAIINSENYPRGMAIFFLIWVILISSLFPFREFFGASIPR